jgi:hypothetical protein
VTATHESDRSLVALHRERISVSLFGLVRRRCWRYVGSACYKQLHSADRCVFPAVKRAEMWGFLHGALVLFMALRKTGYCAVLSSSRPVIAYSVWTVRGGSEWNKNAVRR